MAHGGLQSLRVWLFVVALFRLFSVYIGYFNPRLFQEGLFVAVPEEVSGVAARTFAIWTVVTCLLCLVCAHALGEPGRGIRHIYMATMLSFVIAMAYMALELLVYKTISVGSAASPVIIASISVAWMLAFKTKATTDRGNKRS